MLEENHFLGHHKLILCLIKLIQRDHRIVDDPYENNEFSFEIKHRYLPIHNC